MAAQDRPRLIIKKILIIINVTGLSVWRYMSRWNVLLGFANRLVLFTPQHEACWEWDSVLIKSLVIK